jgi:ribosomal protein S18 acetylase RimI-like enzyme
MNYDILAMNSEDSDYIDDKIVEYNLSKMPAECEGNRVVKWFGKKMIDNDGKIIAGCVAARTVWGTAEVSVLWVDEACRKHGMGSKVLGAVENEAKENGCTIILLDTFDWQAKGFYEKNGYSVFGELKDCPKGHSRYYMSKSL